MYFLFKDSTVDQVLQSMTAQDIRQPCLFTVEGRMYMKADSSAIPLNVCFTEAVELLEMSFHVFGVEYPSALRVFYAYLERLMGMTSGQPSPVLRDFLLELDSIPSTE